MFKPAYENSNGPTVAIQFEDRTLRVPVGTTVMAGVMTADPGYTRTTAIGGCKRSGYCQMGICFECLMEIDGVPNQQACMIEVREGMKVKRQIGARELEK